MIDIQSQDHIKHLIAKRIERLKDNLVHQVDNLNDLHYIRGQIKSLNDLQQDIKDLVKKQEQQ